MNKQSGPVVRFGRLISTTDMKMARKLGEVIDLNQLTGGCTCNTEATDAGTVCLWVNHELYELRPEVMAL